MNETQFFQLLVEPMLKDSTAIANSALTLAIERATDLEMNPIVTLIMLKMLADKNAKMIAGDLPPHILLTAKREGIDVTDLYETLESGLRKILATREQSI